MVAGASQAAVGGPPELVPDVIEVRLGLLMRPGASRGRQGAVLLPRRARGSPRRAGAGRARGPARCAPTGRGAPRPPRPAPSCPRTPAKRALTGEGPAVRRAWFGALTNSCAWRGHPHQTLVPLSDARTERSCRAARCTGAKASHTRCAAAVPAPARRMRPRARHRHAPGGRARRARRAQGPFPRAPAARGSASRAA